MPGYRKLGRTSAHRKAMLRGLVTDLLREGRITTTDTRAKEARRQAEKEAKKAEKAALKAIKLSKSEKKSLMFMLACLFFLFCGSNAITTFFSLFAEEILHKIEEVGYSAKKIN